MGWYQKEKRGATKGIITNPYFVPDLNKVKVTRTEKQM
jgi:hypothetical protein